MSVNYRPTADQMASARYGVARGGRIAYDALDFGVAAKNTYGPNGLGEIRNGSIAVQKYQKLKTDAGFKSGTWEEGAFGLASDAANVSGMVISAVVLPKLAQQTVTSFKELRSAILDPTATTDVRLSKLEDTSRAGAGTVFAAQGVIMGTQATVGILSRSKGIAQVVTKVEGSSFTRFLASPLGKVFNVLLPIADGAVFIGEVIATRRIFENPVSTGGQKVRELLNLGLATLKVSFWVLPGVGQLKEAYALASFAQLGLSMWDFQQSIRPQLAGAVSNVGWALVHPVLAAEAIGSKVVSATGSVVSGLAKAVTWLGSEIGNPAQSWQKATTEISAWYQAYLVGTGRKIVDYIVPGDGNNPFAPAVSPVQVANKPVAPVVSPAQVANVAPAPAAHANQLPPANAPVPAANRPVGAPVPPAPAPPPLPPAPPPAKLPPPPPAPAPPALPGAAAPPAAVMPAGVVQVAVPAAAPRGGAGQLSYDDAMAQVNSLSHP